MFGCASGKGRSAVGRRCDTVVWAIGATAVIVVAALIGGRAWRHRNSGSRPRRGEIWWATVPYANGTGAKLRPCLVVARNWRGVVVLKITSQDKSRRRDHVLIPTQGWDPWAKHDSYLNVGEPIVVPRNAFQRRAGTADRVTLDRVERR